MVAIVADDLSGACDTAVKLSGSGHSIQVLMAPEKWAHADTARNQVIALATNTRAMKPEEAYQVVFDAAIKIADQQWSLVYKKVDSLLRGNVAAELEAMMNATAADMAILVPAIPANGRVVRNGMIISPAQDLEDVDAVCRLQQREAFTAASIGLDTIRSGPIVLREALLRCCNAGYRAVVLDGENEEDLRIAAVAIRDLPFRPLLSGAAGWIPHLIKSEDCENAGCVAHWLERVPRENRRVLVVAGTANPVTRSQISRLMERPNIGCVKVDVDACLRGEGQAEADKCLENIQDLLCEEPDHLVLAVSSLFRGAEACAEDSNGEISVPQIVETVAAITQQIVKENQFDILFLMGGETAYQVLNRINMDDMNILCEFMPGVPVNTVHREGRETIVVTKSGGFGDQDTIVDLIDYVEQK